MKLGGKFWSATLSKLYPPIFHGVQAAPTRYRDRSRWQYLCRVRRRNFVNFGGKYNRSSDTTYEPRRAIIIMCLSLNYFMISTANKILLYLFVRDIWRRIDCIDWRRSRKWIMRQRSMKWRTVCPGRRRLNSVVRPASGQPCLLFTSGQANLGTKSREISGRSFKHNL